MWYRVQHNNKSVTLHHKVPAINTVFFSTQRKNPFLEPESTMHGSSVTLNTERLSAFFFVQGNQCYQQLLYLSDILFTEEGTAVAQWLRCCATYRKVPGSIPDG